MKRPISQSGTNKRLVASYLTEHSGLTYVAKIINDEFGWILRPQNQDFGIDAHIEIIADGLPTGKIIGVQIKSGLRYFKHGDASSIVFRGTRKHLDYWLNHDLPVIVILYNPSDETAYWQHVTSKNITQTPKGWKMSVPREQKLQAALANQLGEIASTLQRLKDAIQEYKCPHCGAPLGDRGGEWVGSEHYGTREVFQCGYDNTDGFVNHPCPSDPNFPRFSDYELEFHSIPTDTENPWFCIANPKTDMARCLHLHASGCTKDEAEQKIRAQYERHAIKHKV